MIHVFCNEFKSLFRNMIGPIYIAASTAIIGVYFMAQNMQNGYPLFSASLLNAFLVLIIGVPILTMRTFAEERNARTEQLLFTSPISLTSIVMGKYLATAAVFALPYVFLSFCPLIIAHYGEAYLSVDYSFIAAYLVVGLLFVAVGMFISSLTENQVISAVGSFTALLLLYLVYILVDYVPTDAYGTLIVLAVAAGLFSLGVYAITKSDVLALTVAVVLGAAMLLLYHFKPALYENLLPALLDKISVMAMLRNIVEYRLVDLAGFFRVAVLTVVLIVLTQLSLQQRRWGR